MDIGILETCGIIAALSAGLGGPIAVVRWAGAMIDAKVQAESEAREIALKAEATRIEARIDQTDHRSRNNTQRLDSLERERTSTIERIVKVESAVTGIEKSIERVEHGQDRLSEQINDRFDVLADSIREVRTVAPRT